MPTPIWIRLDGRTLEGEFVDNAVALAIASHLPLEGSLERFGQELFFEVPVVEVDSDVFSAHSTHTVSRGDIAYWPPGRGLGFFFGPTPLTPDAQEDAIITASAVLVVGTFRADTATDQPDSTSMRVERR